MMPTSAIVASTASKTHGVEGARLVHNHGQKSAGCDA
jgi:hypothetical protein